MREQILEILKKENKAYSVDELADMLLIEGVEPFKQLLKDLNELEDNLYVYRTKKNNVYEKLKYLNELQGQEETLEKKIKNDLKLDCFVKIKDNNVSCVCVAKKHDTSIANNIMRLIQKEFENKMYITVKFQKN